MLRSHPFTATILFAFLALEGSTQASPLLQDRSWIQAVGTNTLDLPSTCASDGFGGVLVTGSTFGDFAAPPAGGWDLFAARYAGDGSLVWSTQFGTSSNDIATSIVADNQGQCILAGMTAGDLGAPNAGSFDAWAAQLDSAGQTQWVLQFGSAGSDEIRSIASDGLGGAFVVGFSNGNLGGSNAGANDAWLARIDSQGSLLWIRQFGSGSYEYGMAATPDGMGGVYVAGETGGDLFAASAGDRDVWVVRYDSLGNQTFALQLGSSGHDTVSGLTTNSGGDLYLCGGTDGSWGGSNPGEDDWYVAKLSSSGALLWITQDGDINDETASSVIWDAQTGLMVSGATWSDLYGPSMGSSDAFFAGLDDQGNVTGSVQFGTSSQDSARGIVPDGMSGFFLMGSTDGDIAGPSLGSRDGFLARYYGTSLTTNCSPAQLNSTNSAGRIFASGSILTSANQLTVSATQLPPNEFGYFLASQSPGFIANPGGSQGDLCLGGTIGRFNGVGQILNSGTAGSFQLEIDLTQMAQPSGPVMVLAGETWHFQAWHRDMNPSNTSNFTDTVGVTLD